MRGAQPWLVVPSPTDPEAYAVEGVYLVADNLPIEDANLIAASRPLLKALEGAIGALQFSRDYHSDLDNEDQAFCQDKLDAAMRAIAAAKGEST